MKPCLICGAECDESARVCLSCGCADFGPIASPAKPNDPAESSAVEPAPSAPVPIAPAKRRR